MAPFAGELFDRLLEGGDGAAANAEDVEELIPEGLAFGGLAPFALPFLAESDGAVANLILRQWHGARLAPGVGQTNEIAWGA